MSQLILHLEGLLLNFVYECSIPPNKAERSFNVGTLYAKFISVPSSIMGVIKDDYIEYSWACYQ